MKWQGCVQTAGVWRHPDENPGGLASRDCAIVNAMLSCLFLYRGLCIRPLEENITENTYTCLDMTEKGPGKISEKLLAAVDSRAGGGVGGAEAGLALDSNMHLFAFVCLCLSVFFYLFVLSVSFAWITLITTKATSLEG